LEWDEKGKPLTIELTKTNPTEQEPPLWALMAERAIYVRVDELAAQIGDLEAMLARVARDVETVIGALAGAAGMAFRMLDGHDSLALAVGEARQRADGLRADGLDGDAAETDRLTDLVVSYVHHEWPPKPAGPSRVAFP
jgi:hypothetical protein